MFDKLSKDAMEFVNKSKIKDLIALKISEDLGISYEEVYKKINENVDKSVQTQLKLMTSLKNFPKEHETKKSTDEFLQEKKVIKG